MPQRPEYYCPLHTSRLTGVLQQAFGRSACTTYIAEGARCYKALNGLVGFPLIWFDMLTTSGKKDSLVTQSLLICANLSREVAHDLDR